jgi:hypothetical protein
MKKILLLLPVLIFKSFTALCTHATPDDSLKLFFDERPLSLTLSTDYKKLFNERKKATPQEATITFNFPDSSHITEVISINARGHFRNDQCYMPPIMLNFKNAAEDRVKSLNKLKLVVGCGTSSDDGQLVVKEALVYRMYNLLTDLSLRIRMVNVTYLDTKGKVKPYTQFGFILEDASTVAERNSCVQVTKTAYSTESTDREQMTMVAMFEYMIGNLDWSVPVYHNIKLMRDKSNPTAMPYALAYDFDHSGMVNAPYATPPDGFELNSVRDRVYRGYPRSMEELQRTIDIFNQKKEALRNIVSGCEQLSSRYKKEMLGYIDEFYRTINNKSDVKSIFIDNARTQ